MSRRGRTLSEQAWPDTYDFVEVAREWNRNVSNTLLAFVWQAYDDFCNDVLSHIEHELDNEQLERSITQLLEPKINRVMTGDEPFYVQHEVYEYETRKSSSAQPPQYDIAFVLNQNPRVMWALEAKVLPTDDSVSPYLNDLKNEFLTCRYAPFSSEGAMLGYLITGEPGTVFCNIEKKVPCKLHHHSAFPNRNHRYSEHSRQVPPNKPYPAHFRCHHLILKMNVNV